MRSSVTGWNRDASNAEAENERGRLDSLPLNPNVSASGWHRRSGRAASLELIALDTHGRSVCLGSNDTSHGYELQRASSIEARGPVHRQFDGAAHRKHLLGSEQNASTPDVQSSSRTGNWLSLGLQKPVFQIFLHRKPARFPTVPGI